MDVILWYTVDIHTLETTTRCNVGPGVQWNLHFPLFCINYCLFSFSAVCNMVNPGVFIDAQFQDSCQMFVLKVW